MLTLTESVDLFILSYIWLMLPMVDSFINIMQYYYTTAITYDGAAADVDGVKLRNLRGHSSLDIHKAKY